MKEIKALGTMCLEGLTAKEIAERLNRTLASVKCRICQEKFEHAVKNRQAWIELLMSPIPLKEAARIMGVTVWAVKQQKRKLRRAGIEVASLPRANQYGPWRPRAEQGRRLHRRKDS